MQLSVRPLGRRAGVGPLLHGLLLGLDLVNVMDGDELVRVVQVEEGTQEVETRINVAQTIANSREVLVPRIVRQEEPTTGLGQRLKEAYAVSERDPVMLAKTS